tara:strand:+ start:116 stop:1921 length:1806 start_codon:yes stop_codon:yes gene_type:complete
MPQEQSITISHADFLSQSRAGRPVVRGSYGRSSITRRPMTQEEKVKLFEKSKKKAEQKAKQIEQKYGQYFTEEGFVVKTRTGEYDPRQTSLLYQQYQQEFKEYERYYETAKSMEFNLQSIDPQVQRTQELKQRIKTGTPFERSVAQQKLNVQQARQAAEKTEREISKYPSLQVFSGGNKYTRTVSRELGLAAHGIIEEGLGVSQRLFINPKKQLKERKLESAFLALNIGIPGGRLATGVSKLKGLEKRGLAALGYVKTGKTTSKAFGIGFKLPKKLQIPMKRTEFASVSVRKGRTIAGKTVSAGTGYKTGMSPLFDKRKITATSKQLGLTGGGKSLGLIQTTRKGRQGYLGFATRSGQGRGLTVVESKLATKPTRFLRSYEISAAGFFKAPAGAKSPGGLIQVTKSGERKAKQLTESFLQQQVDKALKISKPKTVPVSTNLMPKSETKSTYQIFTTKLKQKQKMRLGLKPVSKQTTKRKLKSGTKSNIMQGFQSKQDFKLNFKTGLNFKQKQMLRTKQRLKTKSMVKQAPVPQIVSPTAFPFSLKLPSLPKGELTKKKGKKKKGKKRTAYRPSLIGLDLPKKTSFKTKGLFTGLEVRRRRR